MNLITVIPLTRQKVAEKLTYFTASEPPVGAVVSVPLRTKTIHAVVAESRPAETMKAAIKSAPYEIRKLGKVKAIKFFPVSFMESCKKLADYAATSTGAVIDTMVNNNLLESVAKIAAPMTSVSTADALSETCVVQGDDSDRVSSWRSLIRQEFAHKKSLAFYLPTIEDASRLRDSIAKGIEDYIFILHGDLTKKKITDAWQKIANTEHPVVVVATGSFSVLPRNDIDTVVIERENGRGWITQKTPYLDLRRALETVARQNSQKVYLADGMLRVETLHRLNSGEVVTGTPFKWRSISSARDELVDMVRRDPGDIKPKEAGRVFRTVSDELGELMRKNRKDNTHLFVFAVRRGMSSITVCDDCETIVTCDNCSTPVVLHMSRNRPLAAPNAADLKMAGARSAGETGGAPPAGASKNFFMCHKCGGRRSADLTCKNCGGWRLTPLGAGIDRVYEEIRERFPEIDIFKIDSDETTDEKQITAILERFKTKPGSILLGTELAMARLPDKIEHVAIVSLDSLFALPDFRIPEKVTYLLIRLRATAERTVLVQTRRADEKVFEYGLKGNLSDFYRQTLEDRKHFDYPPYKTLVKITIEGKKDPIARTMAEIRKMVEPYDLEVFPAFTATIRGNSVIHGLIRIEQNRWPDMALVEKLRALPPNVSVKVNPESLL